jgi:ABC-type spermidine/putrescine transport system permease subunit II
MSDYQPTPQPTPYTGAAVPANERWNVLAIVSLILAFVVSLGGIICGHIALAQIKKTGEKGRGLALAGTILGYVFTVLWIIGIIAYVAFFAYLINSGYTTSP